MAPGGLSEVGFWQTPWFMPWAVRGVPVAQHWVQGQTVAQALNAQAHAPVRFVPQADLPQGHAYEDFIFHQRCVPTRDNLHDFFNGLCWMRFPLAKQRLNQLQAQEIAQHGVGATRGPVRDALTLFDENVLLLQASDAVWQALQQRDWHTALWCARDQWRDMRCVLFGHALLEKLVQPYKSITAHVYRIDPAVASGDAALDAWLQQDLQAGKLARKPFVPLPVLGIPGWCSANQDPVFYEDVAVFRRPP